MKILLLITTMLLSIFSVNATKMIAPNVSDIDTSIIDKLDESKIQELNVDFKLKTFNSCENLESVMGKYIKDYYKNNKSRYNQRIMYKGFGGDMPIDEGFDMLSDSVLETKSISKSENAVFQDGGDKDFSKTNSQVDGVDESDIIKTDGKYVYYYNASQNLIYIIDTVANKVLKKIALPKSFFNPVLYLGNNKLVILASGYSNTNYSKRGSFMNRNSKTYTIVYDITDKTSPKLTKLYVNDGDLRKFRKIGKYVYVLSNNSFNIPFHSFKSVDDININSNNIIPKKLELSRTYNKGEQNLKIRGKSFPFNIKAGNIAKCNEIEYSLPDAETLKKFNFNPSYNIISIINIEDPSEEVKTKVIAGSNSEIYMSLDNLYLTENIFQNQTFKCPSGTICAMPFYYGGRNNTIIHKMNIVKNNLKYQDSTIIPGSPLTQYSMDEKDDKFRIITSTNNWGQKREQHTDLFILDENLKLYSSVRNLGENENFKSSRFMGDKLFLVTFMDIDPFYVIDLVDQKNPKVIGKLKIPGYSSYLHPYDENHIIGLGRDVLDINGRAINGGLKIDLYKIHYDKKTTNVSVNCPDFSYNFCPSECVKNSCASACELGAEICTMQCAQKCEAPKDKKPGNKDYIEVELLHSKVLGDAGSSSEAEYNPRIFMWNANKNLLFLPATIHTKFDKTSHRTKDFFQGLVTLNIDKKTGITEKYRITHIDYSGIEKERLKECSKYFNREPGVQECKKLIDGSTYCPLVRQRFVPSYCFADSTVGEYIANRSWNFRKSFVKRALWIDDNVFSISDAKLIKSDILTGVKKSKVDMK